jgi:hypothetical protein
MASKKLKLDPDAPIRVIVETPDGGRAQVVGTIVADGSGQGVQTLYVFGETEPLPAKEKP